MLVLALLVPHQLEPAVGDDLVRIHVGRRAGAALNDVERELVVQLPIQDLRARAFDGGQDFFRESAGVEVARAAASFTIARPLMKFG